MAGGCLDSPNLLANTIELSLSVPGAMLDSDLYPQTIPSLSVSVYQSTSRSVEVTRTHETTGTRTGSLERFVAPSLGNRW